MLIKQRFVVAHPRNVVWDFFGRMEDVTRCMPGASLAEPPAGNTAKFKLSVKLGPISAAFAGDAEVERNVDAHRGTIRGAARDTKGDSRVKGVVDYALSEEAGGTAVDIDVDFALTGRLAQFSRGGVVNDLAARLTADFAKNLETALTAENVSPMATPAEHGTVAPAMPPAPAVAQRTAPANELNAGRLVVSVLLGRLAAFFRSLFRRT